MKPALLELFERYYVPLGPRVVPCLPGLVLALLTAMEDPGSDLYRRALRLLDQLALATGVETFMRVVWGRLLHNAAVRHQALLYISSRFPRPPAAWLQVIRIRCHRWGEVRGVKLL